MEIIYTIIVLILVLNAIFWSLFTHEQHCKVASMFGLTQCPPHWLHLSFGLVFFILAIVIQQRNYLFNKPLI
jgi:hypothetical protein